MVWVAGTTEEQNVPWNKIKQMVNYAEKSASKRRRTESCNVASVDLSRTESCKPASVEDQTGEGESTPKKSESQEPNPWRSTQTTEPAETRDAAASEVRVCMLHEACGTKAVDSPGRQFYHI